MSDNKEKRKKVDFAARKTEEEWGKTLDSFFLEATPRIFQWVGWIIALAGIGYIREISGSNVVGFIYAIMYVFLFRYFFAYFYQIEFTGFTILKSEKAKYYASSFFGLLLMLGVYFLATETITAVTDTYTITKKEQDIADKVQLKTNLSDETQAEEKINSSVQPTETLSEMNENPNIANMKDELVDLKTNKDQPN